MSTSVSGPKRRSKHINMESTVFNTVNGLFLVLLSIAMIYPLLNTVAISFNDGLDAVKGGIHLWPRVFTLKNYTTVLRTETIYNSLMVSVVKTIVIVVTNIFFTSMLAYALSRREYVLARPITVIFVLTMYFNAGLIPNYLLIKNLHLIGTFSVYWIPHIVSVFNLIVIRTYIRSIPESLVESARIDGSGEFRIFFRIIMPLCVPTLATVALFVAEGSWNSWFDTMLYNMSRPDLSTLQYELKKLIDQALNITRTGAVPGSTQGQSVPQTLRAATTVVAAVPILLVYPFLQRYFVTGLTVGGVKE